MLFLDLSFVKKLLLDEEVCLFCSHLIINVSSILSDTLRISKIKKITNLKFFEYSLASISSFRFCIFKDVCCFLFNFHVRLLMWLFINFHLLKCVWVIFKLHFKINSLFFLFTLHFEVNLLGDLLFNFSYGLVIKELILQRSSFFDSSWLTLHLNLDSLCVCDLSSKFSRLS